MTDLSTCLHSNKAYIKRIARRARIRLRLMLNDQARIVVGAGDTSYPGWIPTDRDVLNLSDSEDWAICIGGRRLDAILAEHVWEHLDVLSAQLAAGNCFRYLKRGGYLRVAVPDGNHPSNEYIARVRPGGVGPGCDDHKVLYTHDRLSEVFRSVGFRTKLLEYFDDQGSFHFADWDPSDGPVIRSRRFDERNVGGGLSYTSIILDAIRHE